MCNTEVLFYFFESNGVHFSSLVVSKDSTFNSIISKMKSSNKNPILPINSKISLTFRPSYQTTILGNSLLYSLSDIMLDKSLVKNLWSTSYAPQVYRSSCFCIPLCNPRAHLFLLNKQTPPINAFMTSYQDLNRIILIRMFFLILILF